MRFSDIQGNESAISALRAMVATGRIPHAMLFHENPSSGGLALAVAYLQYVFCEHHTSDGDSCGECPSCRQIAKLVHPDLHMVFPVNTGEAIKGDHPISEMGIKEFRELFAANPCFSEQNLYEALGIESKAGGISVYESRDIMSKLSLSSVSGGYKAVVMFLPERMNVQAANKLLKILEEPPVKTLFILVTQNPEDVMQTISSRCQFLRVLPGGKSAGSSAEASESIRELWASLLAALLRKDLMGCLDSADAIAGLGSREKQKAFCNFASGQIRKIFLCSKNLNDIAYLEPNPDSAYDEEKQVSAASAVLSTKFCLRAASCLDSAAMLISRNVSSKMVFTDLVNRLFVNLK